MTQAVERVYTAREYDLVVEDYRKLREEFEVFKDENAQESRHKAMLAKYSTQVLDLDAKLHRMETDLMREKRLVDNLAIAVAGNRF